MPRLGVLNPAKWFNPIKSCPVCCRISRFLFISSKSAAAQSVIPYLRFHIRHRCCPDFLRAENDRQRRDEPCWLTPANYFRVVLRIRRSLNFSILLLFRNNCMGFRRSPSYCCIQSAGPFLYSSTLPQQGCI